MTNVSKECPMPEVCGQMPEISPTRKSEQFKIVRQLERNATHLKRQDIINCQSINGGGCSLCLESPHWSRLDSVPKSMFHGIRLKLDIRSTKNL